MTRATIDRPKPAAKAKALVKRIRTFRSAENFLNSLTNYERSARTPYNTDNFGLARMNRLLAALGNPHKSLTTVHIAGTKGKGSTATMLAGMLQACGMKTGLYTSPHVLSVRERIMLDGEMITEAAFAKAVSAVAAITEKARFRIRPISRS